MRTTYLKSRYVVGVRVLTPDLTPMDSPEMIFTLTPPVLAVGISSPVKSFK